jgi:hypothetical protein
MRFKKTLELTQMQLLFSRRAPMTLPEEKQRDLTAALADLLLTAAAAKVSEPTPEVQREVKNASETDC